MTEWEEWMRAVENKGHRKKEDNGDDKADRWDGRAGNEIIVEFFLFILHDLAIRPALSQNLIPSQLHLFHTMNRPKQRVLIAFSFSSLRRVNFNFSDLQHVQQTHHGHQQRLHRRGNSERPRCQ